jgi:hypothetical protein
MHLWLLLLLLAVILSSCGLRLSFHCGRLGFLLLFAFALAFLVVGFPVQVVIVQIKLTRNLLGRHFNLSLLDGFLFLCLFVLPLHFFDSWLFARMLF